MRDGILVRFDIHSREVLLRPSHPRQPGPEAAEGQPLAPFSFSTFLGFLELRHATLSEHPTSCALAKQSVHCKRVVSCKSNLACLQAQQQ